MNIFALDKDIVKCAQMHCNRHLIKQILEHNQLMSTAHRMLDGRMVEAKSKTGRNVVRHVFDDEREERLYKLTHINHPSAVWARDNVANYVWLARLTKEMCKEYTYRYGKVHKCEFSGMVDWFVNNYPKNINRDIGRFTYPTPAMPEYCKVPGDVIMSYRTYYVMEKRRMADWSGKIAGRPVPVWFEEMTNKLLPEKQHEDVTELD